MVKIVCGLIGAGKTTYAINNKKTNDVLLDWDLIAEALKTDNKIWIKTIQDKLLQFFDSKGYDIWYITTGLNSNELELLEKIKDIEYIWINTNKKQCIENIKKRNRNDEIEYIEQLRKENEIIYNNYCNNSKIKYNVINVFDTNERW